MHDKKVKFFGAYGLHQSEKSPAGSILGRKLLMVQTIEPTLVMSHGNAKCGVIFQEVSYYLNYSDYTIKCMKFSDMMDDLLEGGKECDIGIGGITVTSERMSKGIQFSFPTYHAALAVLVTGTVKEGSTWSFLSPVHWTLWAAVGLTSLVVPLVVFAIEGISIHGFVHTNDLLRGVLGATYDSLETLLNFGTFTVMSVEARLIVIGYGFLVVIFVNTYVANLTAFLTFTRIDAAITHVEDLAGKRIIGGEVYSPSLRGERILLAKTFTSGEKDQAALDFLNKREFDALIYDDPWIKHIASTSCSFLTIAETLCPFDYAFALPERYKEFVPSLSKVLVELQESGYMSEIASKFGSHQKSLECPSMDEVSETQAVHFRHLIGLWIILAICVAVAAALVCFKWTSAMYKTINSAEERKNIRSIARMRTLVESEYHPHASRAHSRSIELASQNNASTPAGSSHQEQHVISRNLSSFSKFREHVEQELAEMKSQLLLISDSITSSDLDACADE